MLNYLWHWLKRKFGIFPKRTFSERSKEELQAITKILIIDDNRTDIDAILIRDNWTTKYLSDIDHLGQKELIESHIVFVDIHGVGIKMGFPDEGMGLAKAIKSEYPIKKVVLYSTEQNNDIFNDALDYVDKRLYKSGNLYPFTATVQEMARHAFDWSSLIEDLWIRNRKLFTNKISIETFREELERSITKGKLDTRTVVNITGLSFKAAELVVNSIKLYLEMSTE